MLTKYQICHINSEDGAVEERPRDSGRGERRKEKSQNRHVFFPKHLGSKLVSEPRERLTRSQESIAMQCILRDPWQYTRK